MRSIAISIFILLLAFLTPAYAEEFYLKNGDRLTGEIVGEDETSLSLKTESMGVVSVKRDFIEDIAGQKRAEARLKERKGHESVWERKVSLGYNKSSGNTETTQLSMAVLINKKIEHVDELTLKGNLYYSSSNKRMDAQKWDASARYALSFGAGKNWYDFCRLETGHDKFSGIDYRLTPSLGIGYWFYDQPEIKAMAEIAAGIEYTNYNKTAGNTDEGVLIPRLFFEKTLYGSSMISQDILLYPSMGEFGEYRLRSETVLKNPLNERLSLDIGIIDEYDSDPSQAAKKNDLRIISSLTYSF